MISVVIPTLNAEATLPDTLSALVPASVDGLVREVIIVDGGSKDATREIADWAGADVVDAGPGRGAQLAAGAARARQPWLLFLNPGIALDPGWEREAAHFIEKVDRDPARQAAAAFRLALDDEGLAPRLFEGVTGLRSTVLRLPCADQGLLVPRRLYETLGGHRELPRCEDIDFARRLGRSRMKLLRTNAVSNAQGYRKTGYLRRILEDQLSLFRYSLRALGPHAAKPKGERTEP